MNFIKLPETQEPPLHAFIISYLSIRKAVGIIGILLPFLLIFLNWVLYEETKIEATISQYYHTRVGSFFVGLVASISFFLFAYKGRVLRENKFTNMAGFLGLCMAFIPCLCDASKVSCFPQGECAEVLGKIHNTATILFLLILSYISYFIFANNEDNLRFGEKPSKWYRAFGISMIVSLFAIIIIHFFFKEKMGISMFIFETVAFISFGCSWLLRGFLFNPENPGLM